MGYKKAKATNVKRKRFPYGVSLGRIHEDVVKQTQYCTSKSATSFKRVIQTTILKLYCATGFAKNYNFTQNVYGVKKSICKRTDFPSEKVVLVFPCKSGRPKIFCSFMYGPFTQNNLVTLFLIKSLTYLSHLKLYVLDLH